MTKRFDIRSGANDCFSVFNIEIFFIGFPLHQPVLAGGSWMVRLRQLMDTCLTFLCRHLIFSTLWTWQVAACVSGQILGRPSRNVSKNKETSGTATNSRLFESNFKSGYGSPPNLLHK